MITSPAHRNLTEVTRGYNQGDTVYNTVYTPFCVVVAGCVSKEEPEQTSANVDQFLPHPYPRAADHSKHITNASLSPKLHRASN